MPTTPIWILHSVSTEDPASYDDDFEKTTFLGAHTTPDKAKAFALAVVKADIEQFRADFADEDLTDVRIAEALDWEEKKQTYAPGKTRPMWETSEISPNYAPYYFELVQSALDPTL